STFSQMATGVGSGNGGLEKGLEGVTDALDWFTFRRDALKVVILVTDEGADEVTDCGGSVQDYLPGIIASGALLMAVSPGDAAAIRTALEAAGIPAYEIGRVVEKAAGVTLRAAGEEKPLPRFARDEIARLF
ncbi:MAG: hypothetical protein KKI08_27055, partial [Armatimonadetes bacterium]|nr:hypothetical protein [Armatimonadota bacterium]